MDEFGCFFFILIAIAFAIGVAFIGTKPSYKPVSEFRLEKIERIMQDGSTGTRFTFWVREGEAIVPTQRYESEKTRLFADVTKGEPMYAVMSYQDANDRDYFKRIDLHVHAVDDLSGGSVHTKAGDIYTTPIGR